jgi:hypothetical protein
MQCSKRCTLHAACALRAKKNALRPRFNIPPAPLRNPPVTVVIAVLESVCHLSRPDGLHDVQADLGGGCCCCGRLLLSAPHGVIFFNGCHLSNY